MSGIALVILQVFQGLLGIHSFRDKTQLLPTSGRRRKIMNRQPSHKKDEVLPFAITWMDLEGMMLTEKSNREGQIL